MAFLTLPPELTQVHIILRMTRGALGAEPDLGRRLAVAAGAIELGVCAEQRESGLLAVIEVPQLPTVGGMARLALVAEASFVGIVLLVAGDTGGARDLERSVGVTLFARDSDVLAQQRKLCQVMVEISDRFPTLRQMAVIALLAEPRAMDIARLVTTHAVGCELARSNGRGMAGVTIQLGMLAGEFPVAVARVIERHRLPFVRPVTAGAVGSEPPCMGVLTLVTTDASFRYRGL
jgi:hypothetical protein